MPRRLVIAAAWLAVPAHADLSACRLLPEDGKRLACYDALPLPSDVTFQGNGSGIAGPFTINRPQMLNFASNDAILVAYLMDDTTGSVVQNLHHGGAGAGQFLIEIPGTYRVQVNASGSWKISLSMPMIKDNPDRGSSHQDRSTDF